MTTMTGAQVLISSLERAGVETIFGHPGGAILHAYDPMVTSPIRHILARHEQGAGHMASGYAHATGRVGVVMVTSGPAATNLVTPLGDAMMDSIPIVAITGQVNSTAVGSDAFQEADITGITHPVTKHNELVVDPNTIADRVAEAFHIASTGRRGPVLLDFPKDVLAAKISNFRHPKQLSLPGYKPTIKGHGRMLKRATELILEAKRPVLWIGGGVIAAGASEEAQKLAEMFDIPFVTTLMARGAIPEAHPLHAGMPGMHGHYSAIMALQDADLIIAIGTRFDDRVTGNASLFAPLAKIIHIDIDPAEIDKIRKATVPIVGDAKVVLNQLLGYFEGREGEIEKPDTSEWRNVINDWKTGHPLRNNQTEKGPLTPQTIIEIIDKLRDKDSIITAGVGQHQMWVAQGFNWRGPRTFINSGGAGTMGYGIPAAIGAKAGQPDRQVICIDGDGSFQMTSQELATAFNENLPICIVIMNNGVLGMVRQWQELFYDSRYSQTDLGQISPDFVKLAEAYGGVGMRAKTKAEFLEAMSKAVTLRDKIVLIDAWISPDEKIFPMVPPGFSNSKVLESMEEWQALTQTNDMSKSQAPS